MALFKSRAEKAASEADKASDLLARKQFDDALNHLEKSIKKGTTDPQVFVLKKMIQMRNDYGKIATLNDAIPLFEKYSSETVKYGVHEVPVKRLLDECILRRDAESSLNQDTTVEAGQKIIEMANKYLNEFGDEALIMEQIFSEDSVTGRVYANFLFARGYETMAHAVKFDDPQKAAQYMQNALNYNKDRNDQEKVAENEDFVIGTSKTVHCWICGKKATGRYIHFMPMSADITKPILDQSDIDAPLPTNDSSSIYLCRACYTAIDYHNKYYYDMSIDYTDKEVLAARNEAVRLFNMVNDRIDDLIDQLNRR